MKAPEPVLTSRTSASRPAASFFDRIEAVIRSINSTVPVTSRMRVEAAVGGGDVGGLADDGAADLARPRGGRSRRRAGSRSRGWRRTCRACRRCGRGRGRRSSARRRRRRRAPGASIRLTLSPTPPVECLSTTGPGRSQASTAPQSRMARVSATRSSSVHAAEEHRHGEGGDLALGDRAVGQALDHEADLGGRERAAVALAGDDFLREHQ